MRKLTEEMVLKFLSREKRDISVHPMPTEYLNKRAGYFDPISGNIFIGIHAYNIDYCAEILIHEDLHKQLFEDVEIDIEASDKFDNIWKKL